MLRENLSEVWLLHYESSRIGYFQKSIIIIIIGWLVLGSTSWIWLRICMYISVAPENNVFYLCPHFCMRWYQSCLKQQFDITHLLIFSFDVVFCWTGSHAVGNTFVPKLPNYETNEYRSDDRRPAVWCQIFVHCICFRILNCYLRFLQSVCV